MTPAIDLLTLNLVRRTLKCLFPVPISSQLFSTFNIPFSFLEARWMLHFSFAIFESETSFHYCPSDLFNPFRVSFRSPNSVSGPHPLPSKSILSFRSLHPYVFPPPCTCLFTPSFASQGALGLTPSCLTSWILSFVVSSYPGGVFSGCWRTISAPQL